MHEYFTLKCDTISFPFINLLQRQYDGQPKSLLEAKFPKRKSCHEVIIIQIQSPLKIMEIKQPGLHGSVPFP